MNCMNRSVNYGSECTVVGLLVIGAELIESLQFAEACSTLVVVNKQHNKQSGTNKKTEN